MLSRMSKLLSRKNSATGIVQNKKSAQISASTQRVIQVHKIKVFQTRERRRNHMQEDLWKIPRGASTFITLSVYVCSEY